MINGITFAEQLIKSKDFAHFMYTFLNHANGVTKGCDISQHDNKVYVQPGYFIQFGRFVEIVGVEEIGSPEVISGQLYCKVVFEIDLSKANTVSEFNQGYFKVLTDPAGYPEVQQDDLDAGGTVYQMPWCQYIKNVSSISEFRDLREILNLQSVWVAIGMQNGVYKNKFDAEYAAQKAQIEQMIADLENKSFLLIADARKIKKVQLPVAGWQGDSAPYSQRVAVQGVKAADNPALVKALAGTEAEAEVKAYNKTFGLIFAGTTENGHITFYASKKPEKAITVGIKGV